MKLRKKIFKLITDFYFGRIGAEKFCTSFYILYDLELAEDELTDLENQILDDLSLIVDRYSDVEDDHIKYPGAYTTIEQLKYSTSEAFKKLGLHDEKKNK